MLTVVRPYCDLYLRVLRSGSFWDTVRLACRGGGLTHIPVVHRWALLLKKSSAESDKRKTFEVLVAQKNLK